jgi:hypothetical protein
MDFDKIKETFEGEWAVVKQAPFHFIFAIIVVSMTMFWAMDYYYDSISILNATLSQQLDICEKENGKLKARAKSRSSTYTDKASKVAKISPRQIKIKQAILITNEDQIKPILVAHPERPREYWDIFKITLYNDSTKPINNLTVEFISLHREGANFAATPYGFIKDAPFPLMSSEIIRAKKDAPAIYIGGVRSGRPDMQLVKPVIMKIDITSLDYPGEVLSKTIRIEPFESGGVTAKVEIIKD